MIYKLSCFIQHFQGLYHISCNVLWDYPDCFPFMGVPGTRYHYYELTAYISPQLQFRMLILLPQQATLPLLHTGSASMNT